MPQIRGIPIRLDLLNFRDYHSVNVNWLLELVGTP